MRMTQKGQVTVPKYIRDKMGILPSTDVEFIVVGKQVILRKVEDKQTRGSQTVNALRGRGRRCMTTEQIMALTRGE